MANLYVMGRIVHRWPTACSGQGTVVTYIKGLPTFYNVDALIQLPSNDSIQVFTVKVPESDNVSILKKEEKAPHPDHLRNFEEFYSGLL